MKSVSLIPRYNTMRMRNVNTTYMENVVSPSLAMRSDAVEVGQRLEEARKAAGFERKDVYERLGRGFSVSAVQAHENGRNELRPNVALQYCRLYKVALPWLLTGEGERTGDGLYDIDEILLGDAIFTALAGIKEIRKPSAEDLQDLTDAAVRAYGRLKARNVKKLG